MRRKKAAPCAQQFPTKVNCWVHSFFPSFTAWRAQVTHEEGSALPQSPSFLKPIHHNRWAPREKNHGGVCFHKHPPRTSDGGMQWGQSTLLMAQAVQEQSTVLCLAAPFAWTLLAEEHLLPPLAPSHKSCPRRSLGCRSLLLPRVPLQLVPALTRAHFRLHTSYLSLI